MQITETPLTREQGFQLVASFQRYAELNARKIKTAAEEAEEKGLRQHLQQELFIHGSELLGAWIAVIREYQPLVGAISALFSRVNLSQQVITQQQQAIDATSKPAATS